MSAAPSSWEGLWDLASGNPVLSNSLGVLQLTGWPEEKSCWKTVRKGLVTIALFDERKKLYY